MIYDFFSFTRYALPSVLAPFRRYGKHPFTTSESHEQSLPLPYEPPASDDRAVMG